MTIVPVCSDLDELHDMMDDISEQNELIEEMSEIFTRPIGMEFDEVQ